MKDSTGNYLGRDSINPIIQPDDSLQYNYPKRDTILQVLDTLKLNNPALNTTLLDTLNSLDDLDPDQADKIIGR